MTNGFESLNAALAEHLETYQAISYSQLAKRLDSPDPNDRFDVSEGTTPDGASYTIETNVVWDDPRKKLDIRVMADLSSGKRGCLFGFLPIFVSDAAGYFVITPDGAILA